MACLVPQSQAADQGLVALFGLVFEVRQQFAAASDGSQQTPAAVHIFGVDLQMLGQCGDLGREQRDLHGDRSGVFGMGLIPTDHRFFLVWFRHVIKEIKDKRIASGASASKSLLGAVCLFFRDLTSKLTSKLRHSEKHWPDKKNRVGRFACPLPRFSAKSAKPNRVNAFHHPITGSLS